VFPITLGQLADVVGGKLVRGNPRAPVHQVVYFSVKYVRPGTVFFLNTPYMNKFNLSELRNKQSAGIVAPSSLQNLVPAHHPLITVSDTNLALWRLTKWARNQSKALTIGITGSQGKTTTKEMLTSILKRKYYTFKSPSNNNVAAYIPSHLFNLNSKHQVAVIEMGMSSFGNIRIQCLYAKPKIGIVTNVGEAHVGNLGHSVQNVAKAKQELIDGLVPGGLLVTNADDPGSRLLSLKNYRGKVVTVGIRRPASLSAQNVRFSLDGMRFTVSGVPYYIPTWGVHNVYNALAAIAVAQTLKVPTNLIQEGLKNFPIPYMRLQRLTGENGHLLINDAYNANPSSMIAGLKVLRQVAKGRTSVAVLGDIQELGGYTEEGHARVGRYLGKHPPGWLITIGSKAAIIARAAQQHGMNGNRIRSFTSQLQALRFIRSSVPAGSIIYFKASRKIELEWLVNQLKKRQ
jgi:UDP-N-acetylmuramoyl-tripeptide--D-alanyl-D-alanine ligase